jgi:transcriptional regulator with XRE-family HTH domain
MPYRIDGGRLRDRRKASGHSTTQVGYHVSRSSSLVQLWELGYREPTAPMLVELAELYACDVRDFFTEVGDDQAVAQ